MTLEMKHAFLQQAVEQLNAALVDKEQVITKLEDRIATLEGAISALARTQQPRSGDDVGKNAEHDPVPHAG